MTKCDFTICVPTYNRGRRALALVKETLAILQPGWMMAVVDNCSFAECDAYLEIEKLAKLTPEKLSYVRHSRNMGLEVSLLECFRDTPSDLVMIISDEDKPNPAIIPIALKRVQERPGIGVVRGGIAPVSGGQRHNSLEHPDALYTAGLNALETFGFSNNYFSGTIYNRALLCKLGLVARLEKKLMLQRDYPHLYLEGLACAVTDISMCSVPACFEGAPATTAVDASNPAEYRGSYTVGSRMDQLISLRDALREAMTLMEGPFDEEFFCRRFIWLAAKYFYIISKANAHMYAENSIDVGLAVRSFAFFACGAMVRMKECQRYAGSMIEQIDKLAVKYGG